MPSGTLRIGVLAGEASGDILGSRVLAALREQCDELIVEGIGGPLMEAQGLQSMFPMDRLSVMGFVEPLKRLPELLRIRRTVFEHFRDNPPDLFLGIDAPDFNLTLERKLKAHGVKTAHLVSPSVWAWRQRRIHKIKRSVDLMLCLFPFETRIYEEHDVPVRFVGHPLADELPDRADAAAARNDLNLPAQGKILALLPGSRGGEVRMLAPVFLQAARLLWQLNPQLSFVLPAANQAREAELRKLLTQQTDLPVTLISGRSREVMAAADAILLASGTATLEAALVKRPMVVAYRMAALSWWLVLRLAITPFAALPNVLSGRALVPELLQDGATAEAMAASAEPLLEGGEAAQKQISAFDDIHATLRRDYAHRAAEALLELARG
ncbi:lipid-A-disaccharide synthase [Halioglobus japonicus]|uniref:Lipid-A-disaccharide synthase n=1 Tax=Halioglobus japonicus TaxID=930805 RepID=A0AAP8SNA4_9GAMM|nr:lipid-A-disaccharide synthase [Halioglobus japonicus]AQA18307.1 lipid-A-disaccharide synthase [Halioglobus japonicus]PLW86324.1 lipid-A-disaccharide synthase [Halioglobus japonicus]GHD13436.1 lipid-A-disaccharide synthase [Halioglobus japonicus]